MVAPVVVGQHRLAAAAHPVHRPPQLARREGDGEILRVVEPLDPEAAAHVRRRHPHRLLRQPELVRELVAQRPHPLPREGDGQPPVLPRWRSPPAPPSASPSPGCRRARAASRAPPRRRSARPRPRRRTPSRRRGCPAPRDGSPARPRRSRRAPAARPTRRLPPRRRRAPPPWSRRPPAPRPRRRSGHGSRRGSAAPGRRRSCRRGSSPSRSRPSSGASPRGPPR